MANVTNVIIIQAIKTEYIRHRVYVTESTFGVTRPWYMLSCLWDGAYKRTLVLSASLNKTVPSFLITACTMRLALLTSELFLVGSTPVPDLKQLQVLLQFELVDSLDESYVQGLPTGVQ